MPYGGGNAASASSIVNADTLDLMDSNDFNQVANDLDDVDDASTARDNLAVMDQRQVETATAVTTATGSGNITVTVTAVGVTGTPLDTVVAILSGDTAAVWAGKVRTALNLVSAITDIFTVGGTTTAITLTRTIATAHDSTLNIAIAAGTTGVTAVVTSVNTTPGVASPSDASPVINGSVAAGSGLDYSRSDHVHPVDTSRSPLAGSSSIVTVGTLSAGNADAIITVAKDIVCTSPLTVNGTTNLDDVLPGANADVTLAITQNTPGINRIIPFAVMAPGANYTANGAVVPIITETIAAMHITKIEFRCNADPTTEVTGDIKYADDAIGLGTPTLIQAIDTATGTYTSGTLDVAVAAGKFIYLQYDTDPDAATTFHSGQITFDYDG